MSDKRFALWIVIGLLAGLILIGCAPAAEPVYVEAEEAAAEEEAMEEEMAPEELAEDIARLVSAGRQAEFQQGRWIIGF